MFAATKELLTEQNRGAWSQPEAWGVWCEGDHAALAVPVQIILSYSILDFSWSSVGTFSR
jgi:hypothetical protein